MAIKREDAEIFLKNQLQLLPEEIASDVDEAIDFLEDCLAVTLPNKKEVRAYFEDEGVDLEGMSDEELLNQPEVFALPGGRYLVVEA